jgi:hypothetical protein
VLSLTDMPRSFLKSVFLQIAQGDLDLLHTLALSHCTSLPQFWRLCTTIDLEGMEAWFTFPPFCFYDYPSSSSLLL